MITKKWTQTCETLITALTLTANVLQNIKRIELYKEKKYGGLQIQMNNLIISDRNSS